MSNREIVYAKTRGVALSCFYSVSSYLLMITDFIFSSSEAAAVTGAGQLEWLLQGKEKSILEDADAAIDDDNNGQ